MRRLVRFRDLARISALRFGHGNHVSWLGLATPAYLDSASGLIRIDKPWQLVGWNDLIDPRLMVNREGQIGLMLWHPEHGEVWEHYPLFDADERDAAVFDVHSEESTNG